MNRTAILLICTLGSSPEPIVASMKHWRPARVRFVHTPQTKDDVLAKVISMASEEGVDLDAGRYDPIELSDGQNMESCLEELRQLTTVVTEWARRGENFQVVVDFTGGTKCMSAAIAIQASQWPCKFSYVGGTERTKDGVGIVVSGAEKIVYQANPWNALGYQAVEEYVLLFNQCAFRAAENVASVTKLRVSRGERKREFSTLEMLAKVLDAWDRFDHKSSMNLLQDLLKSTNDLRAALGTVRGDQALAALARLMEDLRKLSSAPPPTRHHVWDLIANAKRRRGEGRTDDAVARLYRAIEAIAQVSLKERHGIQSTNRIPFDLVPQALRPRLESRISDGVVALGLQDAYALLAGLSDPVGEKFQRLELHGEKSPLVARNSSILAHGFERVSDQVFDRLWTAALFLADVDVASLPVFPILSESGDKL